MKIKTEEIKAMIAEINVTVKACEVLTARIRDMCPHEEYVVGLTMIGCIQHCKICKACGHSKGMNE